MHVCVHSLLKLITREKERNKRWILTGCHPPLLLFSEREPAAKSLSMLNNSITAVQNTHTTLLKPGHFRGEKFIDFKLLPFGPSPLISENKTINLHVKE